MTPASVLINSRIVPLIVPTWSIGPARIRSSSGLSSGEFFGLTETPESWSFCEELERGHKNPIFYKNYLDIPRLLDLFIFFNRQPVLHLQVQC